MIASTPSIHPLLLIVLRTAKLDRPDGRRLYRYAISERQFEVLRKDFPLRSTRCDWNALNSDQAAAIFVLGAAELGTRDGIPLIAVGPTVKRGFVDHTAYHFGSILKTIEERFGLVPVTDADGEAASLRNMLW